MSNEVKTPDQQTQTPVAKDVGELSFSDYERMRRGEKIEGDESSALADKTAEQKKSSKSDNEETEAKEDQADETDADDSDEELEAKEKPRKKSGFQRRVDKLNAAKTAAQQEAEYWKQQALKSASESKAEPKVEKTKEAAPADKPNPDSFDTHAEYVEALTDWKIEQRDKAAKDQARKSALESEQEKLLKTHSERVQTFKEKTTDFEDVLESVDDVPLSLSVREAILQSENGPELMYELAKNRTEYERINKLAPIAAARELGRFEANLAAKSKQATEEKPKKLTTNAPKPIAPVGGGKGSVAKSITDPDLPFADYERMRREQMKRRG